MANHALIPVSDAAFNLNADFPVNLAVTLGKPFACPAKRMVLHSCGGDEFDRFTVGVYVPILLCAHIFHAIYITTIFRADKIKLAVFIN